MKLVASVCCLVLIFSSCYSQNPDNHPTDIKEAPWHVDRFRLSAGVFVPITNTDLQVGIKGQVSGTPVNLEKDLGYNQGQLTFLAAFQWRISRRSRLSFNYYNIPRNATHTLDKDIVFKDSTYHVNTSVNTYFNTAIYQVSYGYAILQKPEYELGVMIGAHVVGAKAGISLNGPNIGGSTSNSFGVTAPLPDLGIWGGYTFSDRFAVNLDIDYLALTIDNISGSIFAYNLIFMYRLLDRLDISLGYSGLNFKLDAVKKGVEGNFKWGYNGPSLGVSYAFGKESWKH
jgi:hypothetical protein